jgi:hypothetical protein
MEPLFMLIVSTRTLNILAALTWYLGGFVLLFKGRSLLVEAGMLQPDQGWLWLAVAMGLLLGSLKAKFLFSKSCRQNLNRIAALDQPKFRQFFRPGFFLALAVMIATGATLSRLARNNYPFLIGVGILDLSLAVALLGSGIVFWRQKAFAK